MYCSNAKATANNYALLREMDEESDARLAEHSAAAKADPEYDGYPLSPTMQKLSARTDEAVNNFTCKTCGNTRCSQVEYTCWKCGGKL